MNDELVELCRELMDQFDMQSGEYPSIELNVDGEWQWGVVNDELARTLLQIQEILHEISHD
jgi:hypothetical protein